MTNSPFKYIAREGVYLSRRQLRKMRCERTLGDQARHRASALVAQAGLEAERLQRQGYSLGYEAGLLAGATALMDHFCAVQALTERLQQQVAQRSHALLSAALDHPEVLLSALEEGLAALAGPPDTALQIRLPAAARGLRSRVDAALRQAGRPSAHLSSHHDTRLIMRCGEQVFECDPPAQVAQAQRRLLAQFAHLPDDCARLGAQAAQQLRLLFEQHFVSENGAAAAPPDQPLAGT